MNIRLREDGGMYLHEAMLEALRDQGAPMTSRAIADVINAAGSYECGDGRPLRPSLVSARANKYSQLFGRTTDGTFIELRV